MLGLVPPPLAPHRHCKAPSRASAPRLAPCARDVWGTDHLGDLVWAILRLCALITSFGTDARSDLFPPLTSRDESCPITLAGFGEGTVRAFWSLHPCAVSDMEPSTLWPHSGY